MQGDINNLQNYVYNREKNVQGKGYGQRRMTKIQSIALLYPLLKTLHFTIYNLFINKHFDFYYEYVNHF